MTLRRNAVSMWVAVGSVLALLVLMAAPAWFPGPGPGAVPRPATSAGPAAGLPLAGAAAISAVLARHDPAFLVTSQPGGLSVHNAPQSLVAAFGRRGLRLRSGAGHLGLSFRAIGRGSRLTAISPVSPRARANHVLYRYGSVAQWFTNGPLGLEQGFTVDHAPAGGGSGALTLALGLSGNLRAAAAGARGLLLSGPGGVSLRYGGLVATDAGGHALRASLAIDGGRVLIRVDDRGAAYPVRIDPFVQQAKLTDPSGVVFASLGQSLAVAGNTAVAGASGPGNTQAPDIPASQAEVFVAAAGGWAAGAAPVATLSAGLPSADDFGAAVAVSADGSTIVVGAPDTTVLGHTDQGVVYVFQRPGGGWTGAPAPAATLYSASGFPSDFLGRSVAISADGSTVAAGLPQPGSRPGGVYVFKRGGSTWATQASPAAVLTKFGATNSDQLGASVAISGDTIVAGAVGVNSLTGAAYVYEMPSGFATSSSPTASLFAGGGQSGDFFGTAVAISASATTVAVGAPGRANSSGAVYVYPKPGTGWTSANQTATLTTNSGGGQPELGHSVAVDGTTIAAGAFGATVNNQPGRGAADVFAEPVGGWINATQDDTLIASDGINGDGLGSTVAISNGTVIAGVPNASIGAHVSQGALYAFGSLPVTTVALTPAAPNGLNGWYTVPVNVSVSASAVDSSITGTSCVLSPPSPPASLGAIPAGCAYGGAGAAVSSDGQHTLYAASADAAGVQESPTSTVLKIDRTPPTLKCAGAPLFNLGGSGGLVSASVADATSGPQTATVSVHVGASSFGKKTVSLRGADNAGNATTISCPYRVTAPGLKPAPSMTWTFNPSHSFTSVQSMVVASVPGTADVKTSCSGRGCPFRSFTSKATAPTKCAGKGKHKKCTKPKPGTRTVNLSHLFSGRHLGVGTKLTVEIVQTNRIGKVYEFKIRAGRQPSGEITCIAPGSNSPGSGC